MNCPERLHIETDSPLAYLKEYDEWLPVPLVDQRRGELNKLMSILYGDKRTQSALHVDLNTVTPIYLWNKESFCETLNI